MAKNVKVDAELCIGCGLCVSLAPDCFKLNDSGKSEVIGENCADEAKCQEAVDSCPVRAISE